MLRILAQFTWLNFFPVQAQAFSTVSAQHNNEAKNQGKPKVVFVLGGPGSGKGTQCGKIKKKYGWVHLSAGELLREEMNSQSENATIISDYIKNGKIVPNSITVQLLKNAMVKNGWDKSKFLIDGYPRSDENFQGWQQVMGDIIDFQFVIVTECSIETMKQRILARSKDSQRTDDNEASLQKRFVVFQQQTEPVISYYEKINKVVRVNANLSPEDVFEQISRVFENIN